jgi:hypothetical protein
MAVTNAKVLTDNVEVFASDQELKMHSRLATYYDARRHCLVLAVTESTDPFPVLWGVLLGEVAHGFRCCLDHLAWALYKRGRTPNLSERQERNVSFPIHGTRKGFNRALDSKLPGVRRADRGIVRRYQPYMPGESRAHRHVFTILQELSNEDKHRAIQRVIPITEQIGFSNFQAFDCIPRRFTPGGFGGRLDPGAELLRIYVKPTECRSTQASRMKRLHPGKLRPIRADPNRRAVECFRRALRRRERTSSVRGSDAIGRAALGSACPLP